MKVRQSYLIRLRRKESLQDVYFGTNGEIDPGYLSKFERGLRGMGLYKLKVLANHYQTTIDEMVQIVDMPQPVESK